MIHLTDFTLPAVLETATAAFPRRRAFQLFSEGNLVNPITYQEFRELSHRLARLLGTLGCAPGDRVLLLSENRPEWPISYFGISVAGAIIVPVLTDFINEQIATIAEHAQVRALCVTERMASKLAGSPYCEALPWIYIDTMTAEGVQIQQGKDRRWYAWSELPVPTETVPPPTADEVATIIYTSGTTGNSKGVMLTHGNLIFEATACRSIIKIYSPDRFLSILPLAHTYECTIGMLIAVLNGACTTYLGRPPTPSILLPAMQKIRPTIMLTVPLIIEKTYRSRIQPALETHPLYKNRFTRPLAIRIAGLRLLKTFGGAIRFFGIGGAPLAADVEEFLYRARFPYAIGYGLTETAPLLAGAHPCRQVLRSTGPALKGVELRIVDHTGRVVAGVGVGSSGGAPSQENKTLAGVPGGSSPETPVGAPRDSSQSIQAPADSSKRRKRGKGELSPEGEIQARGPNVMKGYYRDPERTREAFTDDGWFKTGDLGCMDARGNLYIRGRLKALILGPAGENIYPEEIESLINASGYVDDALVYADEKGNLIALVYLNEKARTMLAAAGDIIQETGHSAMQGAEYLLQEIKNFTNKQLAAFSRIHRVEIQEEPFEKTATQKIKRFLYPKKK